MFNSFATHTNIPHGGFMPGLTPFFPTPLGAEWVYNNGNRVVVSDVKEHNGVWFACGVDNKRNDGYTWFEIGTDYVKTGTYCRPDHIVLSDTFSEPYILSGDLSLGSTWAGELNSNWYPINTLSTVTGVDVTVFANGIAYASCLQVTVEYEYPEGYMYMPCMTSRVLHFAPDVGCVKRTDRKSDGSTFILELTEHNLGNGNPLQL
ncbi:MAG: hypothetical protein JXO49_10640 [Deltaproteobacteria bacterium]|nr:hypothetical protein [Candidatus Anaeroferrophillus wilburensis]MBN2889789.1 hypothetical protein [Deltaproteobacteria bacterium]